MEYYQKRLDRQYNDFLKLSNSWLKVWNDDVSDIEEFMEYWQAANAGTLCMKVRFMDYFLKLLGDRRVRFTEKAGLLTQARCVKHTMGKMHLLMELNEHGKSCVLSKDYKPPIMREVIPRPPQENPNIFYWCRDCKTQTEQDHGCKNISIFRIDEHGVSHYKGDLKQKNP